MLEPYEILIDVRAFGINRLDLEMKKKSSSIGVEVCGVVKEIGDLVKSFKVGDKVCSLVKEGGYSEEVRAPEDTSFLLPEYLTFVEGAALPESLFTIALNLFEYGNFSRAQKILIQHASGGVGNLGLEIARALNKEAYATTSRNETVECLNSWGAKIVFTDSSWIKDESFDLILDNSGADQFESNIKSLTPYGHLSLIDAFSGEKSALDLGALLDKSLTLSGTLLRPRSLEQKKRTKKIIESEILPVLLLNKIRPHIFKTFKNSEIDEAHDVLQNRSHVGKLVGER